jgi:N-acetylneuraminic acid mutarotase
MAVGFSGFPVSISARQYPQGVAVQSSSVGLATQEFFSTKTPWPMSTPQEMRTLTGSCANETWYAYHENGTKADIARVYPRKFMPGTMAYWGLPIFYGATAEHYNGKIYIYGGYKRSSWYGRQAQRRMWEYDIASNMFTDLGDQDAPTCYYHGSCVHAGKMWVFGGRGQNMVQSDLWAYDFVTKSWERKAMTSHVAARHRFGRKIVVIDNKFYVWGGLDSNDSAMSTMCIYDVATDTWADNVSQGTNPPSSRYDQAVCLNIL